MNIGHQSIAGGLGAWSDFSATADGRADRLHEAAGVEVPGAGFVVLCFVAYLVTLVPINWLVFRTLGHVEWAWIAAPIIAIVGTWVIVQRARLDIGFVRAHTEIGDPGTAAGTSAGTPLAVHCPLRLAFHNVRFSVSKSHDAHRPISCQCRFQNADRGQPNGVNFQRYDDVRLVGLPISSNSTGMVHSEQMQTLDGPIRIGKSTALGGGQIENRTKLELHSVCVVRKPTADEVKRSDRKLEGRWIGELSAGQSASFFRADDAAR